MVTQRLVGRQDKERHGSSPGEGQYPGETPNGPPTLEETQVALLCEGPETWEKGNPSIRSQCISTPAPKGVLEFLLSSAGSRSPGYEVATLAPKALQRRAGSGVEGMVLVAKRRKWLEPPSLGVCPCYPASPPTGLMRCLESARGENEFSEGSRGPFSQQHSRAHGPGTGGMTLLPKGRGTCNEAPLLYKRFPHPSV
jgi:hypothetical protein